jgi:hypothetical protein
VRLLLTGDLQQLKLPDNNYTKLIVLNTRMSDYGYWVVEIGVASGKHVSIMVCKQGITPCQAEQLATTGVTHALTGGG